MLVEGFFRFYSRRGSKQENFAPPGDSADSDCMSRTPDAITPPVVPLSRPARYAISVLVTLHVLAVFTGPWAVFAPRGANLEERPEEALLAGDFAGVLGPYIDATFLNHGYRFFAPEPGPSHLVRYEAKLADGRTLKGSFPNRDEQWPRLLYHRHFMLAEFLNRFVEVREQGVVLSQTGRQIATSFARHLQQDLDADEVQLFLQEHTLPSMRRVRDGLPLTSPVLYLEVPLVTVERDKP